MYSRKLHVDGEDPQRLYRALRQLYSDGVRIPFGKPYTVRKNARRLTRLSTTGADFCRDCGGLSLVDDSRDSADGLRPYDEHS